MSAWRDYLRKRIVDKRMKRMKILNIKNMVDLKRCIEPIKSLLERKYVQYKIVLFFFFFSFLSNLNQDFILFWIRSREMFLLQFWDIYLSPNRCTFEYPSRANLSGPSLNCAAYLQFQKRQTCVTLIRLWK